jgi:hypothetical protein
MMINHAKPLDITIMIVYVFFWSPFSDQSVWNTIDLENEVSHSRKYGGWQGHLTVDGMIRSLVQYASPGLPRSVNMDRGKHYHHDPHWPPTKKKMLMMVMKHFPIYPHLPPIPPHSRNIPPKLLALYTSPMATVCVTGTEGLMATRQFVPPCSNTTVYKHKDRRCLAAENSRDILI